MSVTTEREWLAVLEEKDLRIQELESMAFEMKATLTHVEGVLIGANKSLVILAPVRRAIALAEKTL